MKDKQRSNPEPADKLRIDKWLWAARFFKTRSLAKAAIEGGKVQLEGQRIKVSREISIGDSLKIRQGWDEKIILVKALTNQRRGAAEAQMLYAETTQSIDKREAEAAARKAAGGMLERPSGKPSKKQRRQIHRFNES